MHFKNSNQRKAYFAKNKDAGWHYKGNDGTISVNTSALPNPNNKLLNKEFTKRDRDEAIKRLGGKTHELVEYDNPKTNWTRGIGKLKQYDKRHGVGQRRHSQGSYYGGSIWGKPFEEYGLNKGVRHEYIAHKKGIPVDTVKEQALREKTNNFAMFD